MKVTSLPDARRADTPRRVAIGTFDGVHLGHREVIRGNDTVLTFDPHPMSVIHPEATPKLVMPFSIEDADPDRVVPIGRALTFLPEHPLDAPEAARVAHGVPVEGGGEGPVRLTHGDQLVAIAEPKDGRLQPVVVFAG